MHQTLSIYVLCPYFDHVKWVFCFPYQDDLFLLIYKTLSTRFKDRITYKTFFIQSMITFYHLYISRATFPLYLCSFQFIPIEFSRNFIHNDAINFYVRFIRHDEGNKMAL